MEEEIVNVDQSWKRNLFFVEYIGYSYEERKYEYEKDEDLLFCAIHVYNKIAPYELYIKVSVYNVYESYEFPWYATAILVVVGFGFFVALLYCLRTEKGRATCLAFCACAICVASLADSARSS